MRHGLSWPPKGVAPSRVVRRRLELFRPTSDESGGYVSRKSFGARGTALFSSARCSAPTARATLRRQLAIIHRRRRAVLDNYACHLRIELSKRFVRRQRTGSFLAFEDQWPGGELVLALEIQAGGPGGSIRPRLLWMALDLWLGQLGHSHGVQRHRYQTVHRLQPVGSFRETHSPGRRYASCPFGRPA